MSPAPSLPASTPPHERRVVALDGLRGAMTVLVLVSHYFGEVPHGLAVFEGGWVAVSLFFVLSGYLVGGLILDRQQARNFLAVFYVRRACRTLPIYAVCLALIGMAALATQGLPWSDRPVFPLWSYATFTQPLFMAASNQVGQAWLGPTWTLAVEEHFYLVIPFLILAVPRRHLVGVLGGLAVAAVALRAIIAAKGLPELAALVLLPARADVLVAGVLAALLMRSGRLDRRGADLVLRTAPLPLLVVCVALLALDRPLFGVLGPALLATACAAFILALARGAPEAARFTGRPLLFFARISYAVYLVHVPVLEIAHGLVLGQPADIASPAQILVTVAAIPVSVLVAWGLTVAVEEPITAYGRCWRWNGPRSAAAALPA